MDNITKIELQSNLSFILEKCKDMEVYYTKGIEVEEKRNDINLEEITLLEKEKKLSLIICICAVLIGGYVISSILFFIDNVTIYMIVLLATLAAHKYLLPDLVKSKHKSTYDDIKKRKNNLELLEKQYENEILVIYNSDKLMSTIPAKYLSTMAVSYIIELIQHDRVDSLREAYDSYDQHIHRLNLEQQNEEILKAQLMQQTILEDIQKTGKDTLRNTRFPV